MQKKSCFLCNDIIYSEEREALPSFHPRLYQGYIHQSKVVTHFEGKLHGPMVTRICSCRSGVAQDAESKIIQPLVMCKWNAKSLMHNLTLCFQDI